MENEKIILDTDPGIVEWKTNIEGWVGKDGLFYGKDKGRAVYANSTHKKCEKGHIYRKSWSICTICREESLPEKYLQMPFKEWDGTSLLYQYDSSDKYFRDEEEVQDYLDELIEEGESPEELRLVICEPHYLPQVDESYFEDVLPEDWDVKDVSVEVHNKLQELNAAISKAGPSCWFPGKYRTSLKNLSHGKSSEL